MAKVKKPVRVTGERNTPRPGNRKAGARTVSAKAVKPARNAAPSKKGGPKKKTAAKKNTAPKKTMAPKQSVASRRKVIVKKTLVKKKSPPARPAPVVQVAIKELDPQAKCGPETSVQFLYRVDELVEGRRTPHLVFYDHHGWYCEHGRTCPAVGHAKKHNGQFARAS